MGISPITIEELEAIFTDAPDASAAIRAIVPHYQAAIGTTETNSFIASKIIEHFKRHEKPYGVYRLGHGLELVLGEHSEIQVAPPF